jgi:hypothetical protein
MIETKRGKENIGFKIHCWEKYFCIVAAATLVPEVYFYYFHCKGERKNKPRVESGTDSSSRANQFELGSDPDSIS